MKKVKGVYNGYQLENGKIYGLVELAVNKYELIEVISLDNLHDHNNYINTGRIFNRVKEYKEYLKAVNS